MAADPLTAATVDAILNLDNSDYEESSNHRPPQRDRDDSPTSSPQGKRKAINDLDASLGLDEEVKVTKKRKPISKLDEARLLSAPGIPKLRADACSGKFSQKLRLKGKGHEFSDVARLLNYYQLWLDNLYPRAKFADGLQLIEKVGHSRRLQVMRKEWIDEGKPGYIRDREAKKTGEKEREANKETADLYAGDRPVENGVDQEAPNAGDGAEDDSLFVPDLRTEATNGNDDGLLPDDDDLDALLAEQETRITMRPASALKATMNDDSEGDDDLDALLAEQEMKRAHPLPSTSKSAPASAPKPKPSLFGGDDNDDDDEMDDLDALLAEQEARMEPGTTQSKPSSIQQPLTAQNKESTAFRADEEDIVVQEDGELDVLIAVQEARRGVTNEAPEPSTPTVRAAIPRPALAGVEGADEAEGADMFSLSPVRGTAPIGPSSSQEHEEQASIDSNSSVLAPRIQQASASQSENVHVDDIEISKTGTGAGAEGKDESQGLDAGDMFSSSPVQNE
ncbi:uncharacterized protein Z519_04060 [Cladophialophora bantiana CBS 173.52]|uniref:Chromosome segregation in meiosis protein n=1 Tax=Cladophialophora bantiana (strain ATCC 10958 / CBS 173.52 / CDC B-1940 / NIH 8579) TaxID=1442370 RepID=A0A0D2HX37_CLAB1|nr:uncharacterized protein Z519_04060 [Cladophialophora bantiana CBS 173.52]KIW95475.1 hypothetical protein Z519_04060 [Cladophialophora bantiana CBS 173.52]